MQAEVGWQLGLILPELEPESEVADVFAIQIFVGVAVLACCTLARVRKRVLALLLVALCMPAAAAPLVSTHAPEHVHLVLAAGCRQVCAVPDMYAAAALALKTAKAAQHVEVLVRLLQPCAHDGRAELVCMSFSRCCLLGAAAG